MLTRLAVTPSPIAAGRTGRLSYRLSEAARIACTIERAGSSGWQRVSGLSFRARAGVHVVSLPTSRLRADRYRVSCVPTDAARNAGPRAVAPFRVA